MADEKSRIEEVIFARLAYRRVMNNAGLELAAVGQIGLTVDDLEKAVGFYRDALAGCGVTFEVEPKLLAKMPDHELWMAFFRDPSRNLLALMCEKRP